jgi:hypothetical protein
MACGGDDRRQPLDLLLGELPAVARNWVAR